MAIRVKWSPEAIEDLESIAEFIERDSRNYASAVVNKVITSTKNIAVFPMMGRVTPEISDEKIRECFIYSYRLIYQVKSEEILILAVIHGKRLLESISGRFD